MSSLKFGPGSEELQRIVEQGAFMLTEFHNQFKKDKKSPHTDFWQRELAGFRENLRQTYGMPTANLIVEMVCKKTGLELPKPRTI